MRIRTPVSAMVGAYVLVMQIFAAAPAARDAPEVVAWGGSDGGVTEVPSGLSNVVAVAAGDRLSLALKADGQVVAWGSTEKGQTTVPVGLSNVVAVAAGSYHGLALSVDGRVTAWGWGDYGQRDVPEWLGRVVAIAAGAERSMALTAEGQVVEWGGGYDGKTPISAGLSNVVAIAVSRSGNMALTSDGRIVEWVRAELQPPRIGLSNVVAISGGESHALALTADGRVIGWGANEQGESSPPLALSNVVAIAAGAFHSLALQADGRVVGWGAVFSGQPQVAQGLSNVVAIAEGAVHSLALRGQPPGTAAPAAIGPRFLVGPVEQPFHHRIIVRNGATSYGAAGLPAGLALDPETGVISGVPAKVGEYPITLSAANPLGSVAWPVTLFVTGAPTVLSRGVETLFFGQRFVYQVVSGNWPNVYSASGLPAGWRIDATSGVISGTVAAFGDTPVSLTVSNRLGVGTGSVTFRVSPVAVSGWDGFVPVPAGLEDTMALAGGGGHNLALTSAGRVVAWGLNGSGQTNVPPGLAPAAAIAAGTSHSLALLMDGRVVAWGAKSQGQSSVPAGLPRAMAIAAGGDHSMALTTDGQVVVWGRNDQGQATVPADLENIVAISAGDTDCLALTADGRVRAWGRYERAEFRIGDYTFVPVPLPAGLTNVTAISAGKTHGVALLSGGGVAVWGWRVQSSGFNFDYNSGYFDGLRDVVAVAAGGDFQLHTLRREGGITSISGPPLLGEVVAIAAGASNLLALTSRPSGVAAPLATGPRFLPAVATLAFRHQIVVRNGALAYVANGLPPGLVLDPVTGLISGRPAQAGSYPIVLGATNLAGSSTWTVTLIVNDPHPPPAPTVTPGGSLQIGLGSEFRYRIEASEDPDWFGAGGLPSGWSVDARSGLISGVPVESGDFTVSLMASNRTGPGKASLAIRVSPVTAWGSESNGSTNAPVSVPPGLSNLVAIAAGGEFDLALGEDGRVISLGNFNSRTSYQLVVPAGLRDVVSIAAGDSHALALTADGRVTSFGDHGQTNVPAGLRNVVAIAAGLDHNLALTAAGRVVAWGQDFAGLLRLPDDLPRVVAVAAGFYHGLALTDSGGVIAWGWDPVGQTSVPAGLGNVVAIAAGTRHSLALTADGVVVAWGGNADGQCTVPPGLGRVVAIAAGQDHSVALTADGRVVAWGQTAWNQTRVPEGMANVVGIAAGGRHSLALSSLPPGLAAPARYGSRSFVATLNQASQYRIAVRNGATSFGATGLPPGLVLDPASGLIAGQATQGGIFSVILSATNAVGSTSWPVTVFVNGIVGEPRPPTVFNSGLVPVRIGFPFHYAIEADSTPESYDAAGLPPGLVLDEATGVLEGSPEQSGDFVVTLGASNRDGRGLGSVTFRVYPVAPVVALGSYDDGSSYRPVVVPGGLTEVIGIAAGDDHFLALTRDGRVVAWGSNAFGQTDLPGSLDHVIAIAAGARHSLALRADGRVVAWGSGLPQVTAVPAGLVDVVRIEAGDSYSVAVTADGRVAAWGSTDSGQTDLPVGLSDVAEIAAGFGHVLALTTAGNVMGWGANGAGQATPPADLRNVVTVAAGAAHSLALKSDGQVVAWGSDRMGQSTVPHGLSNVVGVAAGTGHSLALTADGRVVAWGAGWEGRTSGLSNVLAVAAGGLSSLALVRVREGVRLTVRTSTGRLTLSWPEGVLQAATDVAGPWQAIAGARSPWTPRPAGRTGFFRVRK